MRLKKSIRQMLGQLSDFQHAHGNCMLIQSAIDKGSLIASLTRSIYGVIAIAGDSSKRSV